RAGLSPSPRARISPKWTRTGEQELGTRAALSRTMINIDNEMLTTVSGGASPAKLVFNQLEKRFGSQGVVSFSGKPTVKGVNQYADRVSGKFDTNALWGGDVIRSFNGVVSRVSGAVSKLHTHILGSQ